ncbi:MAG TPA: shikimate dehydrogenase [Egibacteraceae bacterium]|nr:shikimate dehydrogenase [Egibacteraceae bacterium]
MTSAQTRLVCLLGHPVDHSVSPQIHAAAFAAAGVDAVYLAFDVDPADLAAAVAGLRALRFTGANITVPHKTAVWDLVDAHTPEAEAVGAVNTLYWADGRLVADNTDAAGLQAVLEDLSVRAGDGVVVFGAGGAARAAAVALGRLGARVEVVARRDDAAADVAALARRMGAEVGRVVDPRLVVNATPLGLRGEVLPERFMHLSAGQTALDLVYGPGDTPFLAAARRGGADARDGLAMLVAQAARSFERWAGVPAPVAEMHAAAWAALGR